MGNSKLVVIDLETTGLDPRSNRLLEVGVKIVRVSDLTTIAEASWLVWGMDQFAEQRRLAVAAAQGDESAKIVSEMHNANNLWAEAHQAGLREEQVDYRLTVFLDENGAKGLPMCGSSVHFDRAFMAQHLPRSVSMFHYRNIDVSSVRELCAILNPEMFAHIWEDVDRVTRHRVLPDISDTLAELGWYVENFFFVDPAIFGDDTVLDNDAE